jgi:hypothetical protein
MYLIIILTVKIKVHLKSNDCVLCFYQKLDSFLFIKIFWTHICMNFLQYYINLCFLLEFYKILDI